MHTFESAFESLIETDIKVIFIRHWTVFWPAENLTGYFVYMEPFHFFLCSHRTLNSFVPKSLYDEGGSIYTEHLHNWNTQIFRMVENLTDVIWT